MIRVEDSEWSDRFSLDVISTSGLPDYAEEGEGENRLCYQLGSVIRHYHKGLSKQIIFTPLRLKLKCAKWILNHRRPSMEWICQLHGRHTLLFTDDKMLSFQQPSVNTSEPAEQNVKLSVKL